MTETNRKKALGKGLEQLFSNEVINFEKFETEIVNEGKTSGGITEIPLDEIRSNPYQPRVVFDDKLLEELAGSIKEHGIIQPIIVKKSIKGYELVAGERRTRAAKLAGLKTIPAIIKDFNDVEMMVEKYKDEPFWFGMPDPLITPDMSEEDIKQLANEWFKKYKDRHVFTAFMMPNPVFMSELYRLSREYYR